MSFFTNLSVDWKNDFCITELTSLCQAMLTTNTNSVSLVTHADTHDQDQEGKNGKADTLSRGVGKSEAVVVHGMMLS